MPFRAARCKGMCERVAFSGDLLHGGYLLVRWCSCGVGAPVASASFPASPSSVLVPSSARMCGFSPAMVVPSEAPTPGCPKGRRAAASSAYDRTENAWRCSFRLLLWAVQASRTSRGRRAFPDPSGDQRLALLADPLTASPAARTSRPKPSTVLQADTSKAAAAAARTMIWRISNNPRRRAQIRAL